MILQSGCHHDTDARFATNFGTLPKFCAFLPESISSACYDAAHRLSSFAACSIFPNNRKIGTRQGALPDTGKTL